MGYLKQAGLLLIAMAAAMAFSAPALATVATSPAGTAYTGKLKGESEGHVQLTGPLGINVQCAGFIEGSIESHGASVTGKGKGEQWEYSNCTNGYSLERLSTGTIEVHALGNGLGTVTSSGTAGRVITPLGFNCVYETNNTDLGTVTDSSVTGGKATIHLNAALPRTGGSAFCGSTGEFSGSGVITIPSSIFID
ncbi:MAG TPA: hypothetical protein VF030_04180 [Solirubrobacterales bacterium]